MAELDPRSTTVRALLARFEALSAHGMTAEAAVCAVIDAAVWAMLRQQGVTDVEAWTTAVRPAQLPTTTPAQDEPVGEARLQPDALGEGYEALLAASAPRARRARGAWFTPPAVAARLVGAAFAQRTAPVRVVFDPAMGAGRLLLAALEHAPVDAMHGIDRDPMAVYVARVAVSLAGGCDLASARAVSARLRVGDALAAGALDGMRADVVVGNPPWVAHAGRSTVALPAHVRRDYRARFHSFAGFPTTHALFVELAARALAPGGVMALLLPTQVADLDGYAPARSTLSRFARIVAPLDELGFGQFAGVTEPTLILVATQTPDGVADRAPWPLREATSRTHTAWPDRTRAALERLRGLARFDPATFGEAGFQTAGSLARTHLVARSAATPPRYSVPLREGRDVEPFVLLAPSRALDPDPAALSNARTRLRDAAAYERVAVVIRQTARFPIAAVHAPPCAFRNSLLAGYTDRPYLLCALLNSALLRSLHLATQRDGRQAVFPQLKVAHLRALPAPPPDAPLDAIEALARDAADAQRARRDAIDRFAAATDRGRLPRGLFAPAGDTIPARRVAGGDGYERTLDEVRAAWTRYRLTIRAIDTAVFAAYGIADDEREGLGEGG